MYKKYIIKNRSTGKVMFEGADLSGADLRGADLEGTDLRGVDLRGADLEGTDLRGVDLRGADLSGADLDGANLYGADLRGADLKGANLYGADLRYANLEGAKLRDADLKGVNLRYAKLRDADLENVKGLHFQIPQEGPLTVYKKLSGNEIAKLRVPAKARRTATPVGRKCRAEYVKVLELTCEGEPIQTWVTDGYTGRTVYKKGEYVYPDKYDDDWRVECTNGIHFFLTREEAEEY